MRLLRIFISLVVLTGLSAGGVAWGADAPAPAEAAPARTVSFGDLSFAVMTPKQIVPESAKDGVKQPSFDEQIPTRVRELDRQRIRIRGFMMPTRLEDDGVREFVIVSSPMMCCYGQSPEIYEFMLVRMIGKPAPMRENMPVEYEGVLRVGDIYEHGYWAGIFALECDGVKD